MVQIDAKVRASLFKAVPPQLYARVQAWYMACLPACPAYPVTLPPSCYQNSWRPAFDDSSLLYQ
jgi:hypothetical protein